jgi:hypothetical protein
MWRIIYLCVSVVVLALCAWAHVPAGAGLVVRGGDFTREAETCRARRRLLMRGGVLSCEAETCRGNPSNGELVGDAANWPKTGRLASVGLD